MISRPLLYGAGGLILALIVACGWLWWSNRGLERDNASLNQQINTLADTNQHQTAVIAGLNSEISARDAAFQAQQSRETQLRQDLAHAKQSVKQALAADRCAHQRMPAAVINQLRNYPGRHPHGNSPDPPAGVPHS